MSFRNKYYYIYNFLEREKCKLCNNCKDGKCLDCKENTETNYNDCKCKKGFYHSIKNDICYSGNGNIKWNLKKKNNLKIPNRNKIDKENYNSNKMIKKIDPNKIKVLATLNNKEDKNLSKLLQNFLRYSKNNEENYFRFSNPKPSMEIRGNITVNIFEGNSNLTIINEKVINEDSFNNSTVIEKRRKTNNLISRNNAEFKSNNLKNNKEEKNELQKNKIFGGSTFAKVVYVDKNNNKEEEKKKPKNENSKLNSKEWKKHNQLRFRGKDDFEPKPQNPKRQIRKRLFINRKYYINHSFKYPEDLVHDEPKEDFENNKPKKSKKNYNNDFYEIPKLKSNSKLYSKTVTSIEKENEDSQNDLKLDEEDNDLPFKTNEVKFKNIEVKPSIKKLSNFYTAIPKNETNPIEKPNYTHDSSNPVQDNSSNNSQNIHNNFTIYNHYFINDKSTTLHHPKNPNIVNVYGKKNETFNDMEKYFSTVVVYDKNFKQFKDKQTFESGNNYVFDKRDGKNFEIPSSQLKKIKNSFRKKTIYDTSENLTDISGSLKKINSLKKKDSSTKSNKNLAFGVFRKLQKTNSKNEIKKNKPKSNSDKKKFSRFRVFKKNKN